ncbi:MULTISPECIES: preprotein translocase subunit SecY [Stenotrophomonas]|jgi:preprotein translocase subunit SecY|uniref:Protein translocase subunit SecY n=8 Tax=Pseudomonadati TaxID=3379134 RepID=A0A0H2QNC8_STEMA|nr:MULTISPECIES: preprotein translocase subunit SecY [Stenotrophomonas]KDE88927.1 preprotein translocase subunit SecY [Stenotrophomonas maltophilia M30]QCZ96248.1 preprotein translocase subunit SecY [Stenotrophomonas sp. pho]TGR50232.1 preprotein translocase subunit SecY [bacterium M00.F.Ca.ET.199.01.1.1]TGT06445.1 preprotein translocase subunit SecY [bacterium M00.F.Ca.ET.177.01.1.1]TGT62068.1 preprotein translocase subunit SecY [Mesorhizobium sp. M00.F.Ca.ET.170.01.1.1]TGU13671.1 preprotein
MAQAGIGNLAGGMGKFTELRQRLLFVVGALIVYRIGCYVPVPGVNPDAMLAMMQQQGGGIVDMFNMFSGGALHRFSIFALNVMPYISASIVMQLAVHIFPALKAMQKEGESGRRKITQYSRIGAVLLAVVQGGSIALALQGQVSPSGAPVVYAPGMGFVLTAVVALTAGTMFLMWVGEQVTERGIGNGVSLIIFAGIVAGLPGAVIHTFDAYRDGNIQFIQLLLIAIVVLAFTFFVVFVERGQRRITVNYARRQGGRNAYMNQTSFLPLKLNMAGVIPAIFASSLLAFPATLAMWSGQAANQSSFGQVLQKVANALGPGEPLHMIVFAALITGFAFFYTALVFNSQETADNLKKSGALIPGIRPGKATADYIDGVLTRLTAAGSAYLVIVCLLPELMRTQLNASFYFGGTSLLIVVVVVMDFIAQVQAHLMSHQYESLLKKANLKGGNRGGFARG